MNKTIKKATDEVAFLIKRFKHINFKTEQEIIEAYKLGIEFDWHVSQHQHKRFRYYASVFDLDYESKIFDDKTYEKHEEQCKLIWKLVDLESRSHE